MILDTTGTLLQRSLAVVTGQNKRLHVRFDTVTNERTVTMVNPLVDLQWAGPLLEEQMEWGEVSDLRYHIIHTRAMHIYENYWEVSQNNGEFKGVVKHRTVVASISIY